MRLMSKIKKKENYLKIIILTVILFLVFTLIVTYENSPERQSESFVRNVFGGNYDRSYDMFYDNFKEEVSLERFENDSMKDVQQVEIEDSEVIDSFEDNDVDYFEVEVNYTLFFENQQKDSLNQNMKIVLRRDSFVNYCIVGGDIVDYYFDSFYF